MTNPNSVLKSGEAITRWLYSPATVVPFLGPRRPNPDHVNYQFGLMGEKTGQSPARERLEARKAPTDTHVPSGPFDTLYVGSHSPNVDFSIFAFTPTLITRALRCLLIPKQAGNATFRIATCGQIRLWLDDELLVQFSPFSHNKETAREVTLELPATPVVLTVELEDLHERNTENYMSVTWLGGVEVAAGIDHPRAQDIMAAGDVMDLMEAEPIFHRGNTIGLSTDVPASFDLEMKVTAIRQAMRGDRVPVFPQEPRHLTLPAGAKRITLPPSDCLPTGAVTISIEATVAGVRIPRSIGTSVLTRGVLLKGTTVAQRKAEVLEIAKNDTGLDANLALVNCARGVFDERTRIMLEAAMSSIEERCDCSDFTILPVLRIWLDYRDVLPSDLQERFTAAILGYRYWMAEPGNDAMWFWSENHVLCFHVAQLVAGHHFGDTTFVNSGRAGTELKADALSRLHRWFDGIDRDGLCEWNSAAYYPIDMLALLSLHDMSPDAELRARAAKLLDRIFIMTGLHMIGGSPAGAQGRSYEKELLSGPANELGAVGAVAFGGMWYPEFGRPALNLCLSDYVPPAEAARLAAPEDGEVIQARYFQGAEATGKLTLWKNRHAQLSTVSDHETGRLGRQQHLLDVQFAAHPFARLWINHPGDRKPWSERRPSKLAGSHWLPRITQHERCALAIYDIPDDPRFVPFSQLFTVAQAFDQIELCTPHMLLLRSGGATAVIQCSAPLEVETDGPYKGALYRANALRTGWAVMLEDTTDDAAYAAARQRALTSDLKFSSDDLRLEFNEYVLDFAGAFSRNQTPLVFDWPGPAPSYQVTRS